jgi:hypothetical protein
MAISRLLDCQPRDASVALIAEGRKVLKEKVMTNYITLSDQDKLQLLREHTLEGVWPNLRHTNWCLHCEKEFDGASVRVWKDRHGELWLECGTPGCSGSPIDWAPYPWWDSSHPLTLKREAKRKQKL